MNVTIGMLCDNYDQIGGVHVALVQKKIDLDIILESGTQFKHKIIRK